MQNVSISLNILLILALNVQGCCRNDKHFMNEIFDLIWKQKDFCDDCRVNSDKQM